VSELSFGGSSASVAAVTEARTCAARLAVAGCALWSAACGAGNPETSVLVTHPPVVRTPFDPRERALPGDASLVRLDDLVGQAEFSADPEAPAGVDRVWEFDGGAEGWTLTGGGGPAVENGRLVWNVGPESTGVLSPPLGVKFQDLRAIEVRLAASAGDQMRLWWSGRKDFEQKLSLVTEIHPGDEPLRYLVKTATLRGHEGESVDRLRLDPTNGAPARVAVESVRLIGREGAYAGKGHGLSQETLANQVRNVVFHRAPSEIAWKLTLPPGARLDAGAGLLEARSGATLSVRVEEGGRRTEVARQTVTDDSTWHEMQADLSRWGGKPVRLVLKSESATPGQIVLWSNPMIAGTPPEKRPRPNVLIYLIDTLRADHLSAYGNANPTSPALDRLAGEGVLFEKCSSPAPWTRPSVSSLLTSLPPPCHGVTDQGLALSTGVVTLAEQLRMAGYVTAAFITSSHAGSSAALEQGYDFLYESPAISKSDEPPDVWHKKTPEEKSSALVNEALAPWLQRYGGAPFFLYLHVMDPHAPYLPPAPYDTMFTGAYPGTITGGFDEKTGFATARTREDLAHVRALYDGDIRHNDHSFEDLIEALRARGALDDTLIVVISDHGEEFHEHGQFEHGSSLHCELLDVPLIMRFPGTLPAGIRVSTRVTSLDVMPTVLGTAGLTPNPDVQGVSLLPLVTGKGGAEFTDRPIFGWRKTKRGEEHVSIERGTLKAIVRGNKVELFDRASDPGEQHDLARKHPDDARRLADEARAWLASRLRVTVAGETERVTVDEEEREWLKSLGYIN